MTEAELIAWDEYAAKCPWRFSQVPYRALLRAFLVNYRKTHKEGEA